MFDYCSTEAQRFGREWMMERDINLPEMMYSDKSGGVTDAESSPGKKLATMCFSRRAKAFGVVAAVLAICFAKPLYELARYAWPSDLYSHILLIPFVSAYLLWVRRKNLSFKSTGGRGFAVFPLVTGLGLVAGYWLRVGTGWSPTTEDYLAIMILSFLLLLVAVASTTMGTELLQRSAFPAAFLVFMVPFPTAVHAWIETFLQHGSADCAYLLFKLSGMPVLREGTIMHLPGFSMQVAPECSGIRSTLVLFITSFVAGQLLLRTGWSRAVLVLAVIPLALVRNGIRILTIGQLCIQVSPDMINSYIHRHGGPIFFAASLVPFLGLLLVLRKLEAKQMNHGLEDQKEPGNFNHG